jgi:SsrA-binding protein
MAKKDKNDNMITDNRKARHNYSIEETFEAGIQLQGTEVKSCRAGKVNLSDSYCAVQGTEIWMQNAQVSEYSHGNRQNHEPKRTRKLLLHRGEIEKLIGKISAGYSLVPLKMYFKNSYAKVLIGLGKGKKAHDKRHSLKESQAKREIARHFRR